MPQLTLPNRDAWFTVSRPPQFLLNRFDLFAALVNRVEKGIAPDKVTAGVAAGNTDTPSNWSTNRTRPMCACPTHAVLKTGATDLESAASFQCK